MTKRPNAPRVPHIRNFSFCPSLCDDTSTLFAQRTSSSLLCENFAAATKQSWEREIKGVRVWAYVKMGHSLPLFLYFRFFRYSWQWTYNINFADDWFRTADLWSQKRLLYQLCHNLCPIERGRIWAKISIPPFQNHFANGTLEYLCL